MAMKNFDKSSTDVRNPPSGWVVLP